MVSTLDLSVGAVQVATWLSMILYGMFTLQVYDYTQADYKDHIVIRLMIAAMWILNTTSTVLLCVWIYDLTVTNYGNRASIDELHPTFLGVLFIHGSVASIAQAFYAYRIKILSGRLAISVVSWILSVVLRMGFIIAAIALSRNAATFSEYLEKYSWIVTALLCTLLAGDFLNSSALCFFLIARSTEFSRNKRLTMKLILWAIETGLITTLCAIVMLVLALTMPSSLTWIAMQLFFPRFYAISLLTSLNNRQSLRRLGTSSLDSSSIASAIRRQTSGHIDFARIEMPPRRSAQDDCWSPHAHKAPHID